MVCVSQVDIEQTKLSRFFNTLDEYQLLQPRAAVARIAALIRCVYYYYIIFTSHHHHITITSSYHHIIIPWMSISCCSLGPPSHASLHSSGTFIYHIIITSDHTLPYHITTLSSHHHITSTHHHITSPSHHITIKSPHPTRRNLMKIHFVCVL